MAQLFAGGLGLIALLLLFVVMIIAGPTFTIWMLNKLFALNLVNDWPTWWAAFWFNIVMTGGISSKVNTKK